MVADSFSLIWFLIKLAFWLLVLNWIAGLFGTSVWAIAEAMIGIALEQAALFLEPSPEVIEPEDWTDVLEAFPEFPAEPEVVENPATVC